MWGAYSLLGGISTNFSTAFSVTAHGFLTSLVSSPLFILILYLKPYGTADLDNPLAANLDRKSTRLNSSHGYISYAVFCLKKKNSSHSSRLRPLRAHASAFTMLPNSCTFSCNRSLAAFLQPPTHAPHDLHCGPPVASIAIC